MTITELTPLRSESERALLDVLQSLGDCVAGEGFARHEAAVQSLARITRHLTPGAAAALANRAGSPEARLSALSVVGRVLVRCGDAHTRRRVWVLVSRYAPAPV